MRPPYIPEGERQNTQKNTLQLTETLRRRNPYKRMPDIIQSSLASK